MKTRRGIMRALRALGCGGLLLILAAAPVRAEEEDRSRAEGWTRQAYDLVVLRPFGLVQTLVGAGFFIVAYPVSLITGGEADVVDVCISGPVDQTFRKPLGQL